MKGENVVKVYLTKTEIEALLGAKEHVETLPYAERTKIFGTTPQKLQVLLEKLHMALYPEDGIPQ